MGVSVLNFQTLCMLCVLCVSVVNVFRRPLPQRHTEYRGRTENKPFLSYLYWRTWRLGGSAVNQPTLLLPDAIKVSRRADENLTVGNGWGTQTVIQKRVFGQDFKRRPRLNYCR